MTRAAHLDGLPEHRTEREDLCFWPCPYGHNEVFFEGFVKFEDCVRHLVDRYARVTLHEAALDTLEYGTVLPRPYRLALACDGSITEYVLALFPMEAGTSFWKNIVPLPIHRGPSFKIWPDIDGCAWFQPLLDEQKPNV